MFVRFDVAALAQRRGLHQAFSGADMHHGLAAREAKTNFGLVGRVQLLPLAVAGVQHDVDGAVPVRNLRPWDLGDVVRHEESRITEVRGLGREAGPLLYRVVASHRAQLGTSSAGPTVGLRIGSNSAPRWSRRSSTASSAWMRH